MDYKQLLIKSNYRYTQYILLTRNNNFIITFIIII